ncbi:dynein assembly factor with WDR repeat domains 1 [Eurytemora carolleeae]|uniref:dynein assembly factor with WDR repeat domains 1 n=1 Tax=Eurytemora carolleeae TaxID=1294199 RepID=UPI000C782DE8|nr:dynein assembly factor with WDR repeat domains 1 [Eurytemora carolleeae]|eukprot:XP_023322400.1 dynein assembly factor with WDR repeat domains 1-like [Eurytemora affinis]
MRDGCTELDSLPVTCIRTKPGPDWRNIIGATYASGDLRIWNLDTGNLVSCIRDSGELLCLSFNPHINFVSVGKGNGEIKLYDLETQKLASILKRSQNPNLCDGHASKVFSIVNHPLNPQEFISGGWDGEIHIWDARRPHSVRRIEGPFIAGEGLDMERKGRDILAGSWRGEHQLLQIDYSSGAIIADIEPERQNSYASCVQYLGKEHAMVGGTDISMFRIVDLKKRKTVASIKNLGLGIVSLDSQKKGQLSKIAINTETHLNILEFTEQKRRSRTGEAAYTEEHQEHHGQREQEEEYEEKNEQEKQEEEEQNEKEEQDGKSEKKIWN